MRTLITAALVALATPAMAASNELSLELGTLTSGHQTYEVFSETRAMPSYGVRLGVGLTERVALIGGYHRVRRGALVSGESRVWANNYLVDELTLGAKFDYPVSADVVFVYATANALGYRGTMRFDGDPDKSQNPDQLRSSALSVGGMATAGMEFLVPNRSMFTPSAHIELGYGGALRHRYTMQDGAETTVPIGEMSVSGLAIRAGVGVRF